MEGQVTEGHKETVWGDGCVLILNCGGDFTNMYALQNLPNCVLYATLLYVIILQYSCFFKKRKRRGDWYSV